MYDLIILGAGPAGITAAIYAERKRMNFLVITGDVGGQTNWTKNVENYTGFNFISGCELVQRFKEHLGQYSVEVKEGEKAIALERKNGTITVITDKGRYETCSLIIATGMTHRKLRVPGEDRFIGRGVVYCATCDAPLFSGADVAVVGGGNSALDAVLQLDRIARKIYLIDIGLELRADPVLIEKVEASGKVTIFNRAEVKEIRGEKFVKSIIIEQDCQQQELAVEGVMVEIGWEPASGFASMLNRDKHGEIVINCGSETSVPGIFAAGDVSNVPAKQIIVATGEGAKAAIAAFNYLEMRK